MALRVTCKGCPSTEVPCCPNLHSVSAELSKDTSEFCISVDMCALEPWGRPRVALKQGGEGRSGAVGALQVLLCHFGSALLPQPSLPRKKEKEKRVLSPFHYSPGHNPLLPSGRENAQLTEVVITAENPGV